MLFRVFAGAENMILYCCTSNSCHFQFHHVIVCRIDCTTYKRLFLVDWMQDCRLVIRLFANGWGIVDCSITVCVPGYKVVR